MEEEENYGEEVGERERRESTWVVTMKSTRAVDGKRRIEIGAVCELVYSGADWYRKKICGRICVRV